MSNAAIISRMSELLSRFETGGITAEQVERQLESHLSALEGIQSPAISRARQLTYELVCASVEEGEANGEPPVSTVLQKIRSFLLSLPT